MSDDIVLVEQRGDGHQPPRKRNALNPEIHAGMVAHIDRMSGGAAKAGGAKTQSFASLVSRPPISHSAT